MAALSSPGSGPHPTSPRVYFQSPGETAEEPERRHPGKVTVKYDRKELRKRLRLEEWILEQLVGLYDCQVRANLPTPWGNARSLSGVPPPAPPGRQ